jgi:FtsP/CotA-like multicopper oxidase with cupredoxin domain
MLMVATLLTLWCLPSFAAPLAIPTGPKTKTQNADGSISYGAWAVPDYNTTANWAYSPPLAKFVDTLPGVGAGAANNLGQYVSVAKPDVVTYPGSDYYEIDLVEYSERMHSDLPATGTRLRGYIQVNNGTDTTSCGGASPQAPCTKANNTLANDPAHFLGPAIVAFRDRPVRIKFTNRLPVGQGGNLFVPVDTTTMGAGTGPLGLTNATDASCSDPLVAHDPKVCGFYTQNRATLHLHGGRTPWISDGTPHQWTTPVGETTAYPQGVSVQNVPDMPDPGPGALTFYYSNQQSARLMFYHDHAFGITRLNVMVGEAAGYLILDKFEQDLVTRGIIPGDIIPLVIQDKTFVDATPTVHPVTKEIVPAVRVTDPLWNWGTGAVDANGIREPVTGDFWMPHVYMPVQNPYNKNLSGNNPFGRWFYGPWFYPPTIITQGPVANPYYDANCDSLDPALLAICTTGSIGQPPVIPGTPHPSMGMEAFMDTAIVNGTAFPRLEVDPRAYRFRILNAAGDRGLNLSLYKADTSQISPDNRTASPYTEVKMVNAGPTAAWPALWPTDGRLGGVPDPGVCDAKGENCSNFGPNWIQIGTEGGFLPKPVVKVPQPITYVTDPAAFWFGVVKDTSLGLMPAERADVIVDFSKYAGQTLILYNDAPTAWPALDTRYDYFFGAPDQRDTGGYGTGGNFVNGAWVGGTGTKAGYGPNTRTIMQIVVRGEAPAGSFGAFDAAKTTALYNEFTAGAAVKTTDNPLGESLFKRSQEPVIVAQAAYNDVYDNIPIPANFPWWGVRSSMQQNTLSFQTVTGQQVNNIFMQPKGLHDEMGASFDKEFGRMSSNLGMEIPNPKTNNANLIIYGYADIPSEDIDSSAFGNVAVGADVMTTAGLVTTLNDGTQIWNISHNGVDTHPIHFHIFDVQVINRLGWDGKIALPDANELGWKDTVRISPLMDTIVALRPVAPLLPFGIPNSLRPLNPALPIGSAMGFNSVDWTTGAARVPAVTNVLFDFGWEYVWHCHILSHEEMDMMRSIMLRVTTNSPVFDPAKPSTAVSDVNGVTLNWTDPTPVDYITQANFGNPANEIGFRVERATTNTAATVWEVVGKTLANETKFVDATVQPGVNYWYRVVAYNAMVKTSAMLPPYMHETASAAVSISSPGIFLTSPANGAIFTAGDIITLKASAASGITSVTFNEGAYSVGISASTTSPFSYDWTPTTAGSYTLTAIGSDGTGTFTSTPITITVLARLAAPATLTVPASTTGTTTLTWGAVTGATGYVVEQSTNAFATSSVVYSGAATTAPVTVYLNGTYSYRVKATAAGVMAASIWTKGDAAWVVSIPVAAPASITYPASSATGLYTVSWAASATPGATYILEESTSADFAGATPINSRSTVTSALIAGRTNGIYFYRVTAVLAGMTDSAPFSGANTGCTVALPAAAPTAVVVPAYSTTGSYTVSWTAPVLKGVITYVVEQSAAVDFAYSTVISTGTATSVAISGKTDGTWFYRVNAIADGYTLSPWAAGANGTAILKATLTSPANGASYMLGAAISMVATATTPVGYVVGGAQFYDNGILVGDNTAGLTFSYSTATVGAHNLTAMVYYTNGIDSISAPATITVKLPAPTITITSPADNAVIDLGTATTIVANPSVVTGANVFAVGFYENGALLSYAFAAPYNLSWTPAVAGARNLTATVYYDNFLQATSAAKPVTINGTVAAPASISVPATNTTGSYSVSWAVSGTAGVTYTLEEATDSGFTAGVRQVYVGTALTTTVTVAANGTYFYRVKASKTPMAVSAAVNGQCIVSLPPTVPVTSSPSGIVTTATPTYTWVESARATSYDIYTIIGSVEKTTNYLAANVCSAGTCSTVSTALVSGSSVYWIVRAKNTIGTSAWSTSKTFVVNSIPIPAIPVTSSPSGTVTTSTPTYTWNESVFATSYDLYTNVRGVATTTNYLSTAVCVSGVCSATSPVLANGASVYWVVKAKNSTGVSAYSSSKTFVVNTVSIPLSPATVSPTGTVTTNTPTYTWVESTGATSYDIYASVNGVASTTNYLTSTVCAAGTCTATSPTLTNGASVYWIVRAKNSAGTSAWSTSKTFVVNTVVAPTVPSTISPIGTGTVTTLTPTYTWIESMGATSYDLFTSIAGVTKTTNYLAATSCTAGICTAVSPVLNNGSSVYWIIKAKNSAGSSAWSSSKTFTVVQ